MKLTLEAENIFRAYKKGSFIIPSSSDVNCEGTYALVKDDLGNTVKVDSVVTHVEYKIIINNVGIQFYSL